ncbi:hypothetical protein GCM10027075_10250 [Streptomyces heilongjiangensis]
MRGGLLLEHEAEAQTAGGTHGQEENENRHAEYLGSSDEPPRPSPGDVPLGFPHEGDSCLDGRLGMYAYDCSRRAAGCP